MTSVFEFMKDLIPYKTCLKERSNPPLQIVANEESDIYYLNESSAYFYELCDNKKTIEDILQLFLETYDVERQVAEADFVELIRDLQWKQVMRLREKKHENI
mgnify:FL=1